MADASLLGRLMHGEAFQQVQSRIDEGSLDLVAVDGLRAPLIAALALEQAGAGICQIVVVTATGRESDALHRSLASLLPSFEIIELPAWETLPHERLSPSPQVVGERLEAIRKMSAVRDGNASRSQIVLASVRAALQPLADNLAEISALTLAVGESIGLDALAGQLVELAYARVDLVTRRGEFAVRGGILDVFPPTADHPYRLDFFGDDIDQIRQFQVADQRSDPDPVTSITIDASRELLLTPEVRSRAAEMEHEFPNLTGMLEKLANGIPVEGMESLAPVLASRLVPLTFYTAEDAVVAVVAPERVSARAASLAETNREFLEAAWSAAVAGAEAPIDLSAGEYMTIDRLRETGGERSWWQITPFDDGTRDRIVFGAKAVPGFAGSADGAVDYVGGKVRDGWSVAITTLAAGTATRAMELLRLDSVGTSRGDSLLDDLTDGVALVVHADLDEGFEDPELKVAVLTEAEFFGRSRAAMSAPPKKLASRRRNTVDPLQLKAGDYVVHDQHGIGKFVELTKRSVGQGSQKHEREYLVIEYASSKRGFPGDRLYVPTDQLDQLTKYVGGEAPTLSKMGGSDWSKAKGRARRAVREIAVELVKLYSARMASKGFAFDQDTPWQHELEEAFPFAETPDQLQTIDEVKADMERPVPMDRLVAGDVGFGKTEIAVRASFKAIQNGKQVALLVPTTLLARQHFETFSDRFAGFPVRVRQLSRFQTEKESRETIAGLADGTVDMVIGTHRILSKSLTFKNLGLVIIDEEQRFGVEHKERLKQLKTNVDVLAMSATPIPRTLEMAVTGIREMSTLATPPEQRHPVLTYVGPYSDRQVAAAIRREMLREGQVFFVHNRVTSINRVASTLAELVPEARIAVAHGQMDEKSLERVLVDFWERKFDVLVSTTIIETGMDIQNANTLIVDQADRYGLSQLHQLRGRVGRGRERAYAYFLHDPLKPLSEVAQDRLETIAANNELGSGMQVAMKDLELRGAGNLLGGEQSGHIAGVGFDLYLRMVGEAVSAFRGDQEDAPSELRLELPIDAHIPESYVDSERLRLEAYQKLATASSPQGRPGAIDAVLEELVDRYGEAPEPVQNLVAVSRLRRELQSAGLSDVVVLTDRLRVAPASLPDSLQVRLRRMYPTARYVEKAPGAVLVPIPEAVLQAEHATELIAWVRQFLVAMNFIEEPAQAPKP